MTKTKYLFIGAMLFAAIALVLTPTTASAKPQVIGAVSLAPQDGGGGSWGGDGGSYVDPNYGGTTDCTWYLLTCRHYFNWYNTQKINGVLSGPHSGSYQTGATGLSGLLCTMIGTPIIGGVCGVATAVTYQYTKETFAYAVQNYRCVKATSFNGSIYRLDTYKDSRCK